MSIDETNRLAREESFHDQWAAAENPASINVAHINEAATSPELRFIHTTLGDIRNKRILDVGCGKGEVAVYFAQHGAKVTALDISSEMLRFTQQLAQLNNTTVETKHAPAENMLAAFSPTELGSYDILYVGNLLHHVDIEKTLPQLLQLLQPEGTFASWDPVAYNPIINVYRKIAMNVRTIDEHPLTKKNVDYIKSKFHTSTIQFYWLTTLVVFLFMTFVLFRNPNKIRFWKVVIDESKRWEFIYKPLAALDRIMIKLIPPLRWLCWNVVVIGRGIKSA
jgi:SAM-dependent methyltransferase